MNSYAPTIAVVKPEPRELDLQAKCELIIGCEKFSPVLAPFLSHYLQCNFSLFPACRRALINLQGSPSDGSSCLCAQLPSAWHVLGVNIVVLQRAFFRKQPQEKGE